MPDDEEFVVLVDEHGEPIGRQRKADVHSADTPLHLAFSLYLFDVQGRLLMTRRALSKVTWPGVWTNTCCGHPMPGEPMTDAVVRRLQLEMGLQVTELRCALPDFAYRVRDVSGVWENEVCPVFTGRIAGPEGATPELPAPEPVAEQCIHSGIGRRRESCIDPNPAEVMDWAWVNWDDVVSAMISAPFAFSPWAVDQVARLVGSVPSAVATAAAVDTGDTMGSRT